MKKLVSILIPAYNAEKWIDETISSAINQLWPNKELIIVDDGSIDDTYNITKKYESKKVKVIRQENKGASAARNAALTLAQGDYIQWLDADDLLAPDKISKQLEYNNGDIDPNILLSSTFGTFYHNIKRAKFAQNDLWEDLYPIDYFLIKFNEGIWMSQSVWLVSRAISEKAGPWNENLTKDDDGEYFCRVVSVSKMIKFIPDAKCFYRKGNVTLSGDMSEKSMESLFLSRSLCIQWLLSLENTDRTRSASLNFLQSVLNNIYTKRDSPRINTIINKLYFKAEELGANLRTPNYKWKYETIKAIFGSEIADKMRYIIRRIDKETRKKHDKLYQIFTKND